MFLRECVALNLKFDILLYNLSEFRLTFEYYFFIFFFDFDKLFLKIENSFLNFDNKIIIIIYRLRKKSFISRDEHRLYIILK